MAVALLSLRPSSAATERTFSKYSFIHTKKRNKLTKERAGKLTYIACNLTLANQNETRKNQEAVNSENPNTNENDDSDWSESEEVPIIDQDERENEEGAQAKEVEVEIDEENDSGENGND